MSIVRQRKKRKRVSNVTKAVVVLGIGGFIYGYKVGHDRGLDKGIAIGYISAGSDMVDTMKQHAKELRLAREV